MSVRSEELGVSSSEGQNENFAIVFYKSIAEQRKPIHFTLLSSLFTIKQEEISCFI